MSTLENNIEKLLILASGLADDNQFNDEMTRLRKEYGIPKNGFPSTGNHVNYRSWKNKATCKQLQEAVKIIVKEQPDLTPDMESLIYNHVLFPDAVVGQISGYKLSMDKIDGVEVCKLEFSNYLDPATLKKLFKSIKEMNDRILHLKPLGNIKQDIEILKLSQRKGDEVKTSAPDIEEDSRFSDESIIATLFTEEEDTPENLRKNRDYVRKRRSLAEKRIKALLPNTYSGCESK